MENQKVSQIIKRLYQIQLTLKQGDFTALFGETAPHLWQKYSKCSHNLLDFFNGLDIQNQVKLCSYINKMNL